MNAVYTVGVKPYVEGVKDSHGNPLDTWGAAVDLSVYAVYPRTSSEPDPDRSEVVVGMTILAPIGSAVGPYDRVVYDGVEYEVDGDVADWSHGPFGWAPGLSINLRRVGG